MTLQAYPAPTKIAANAAKLGYVVGVENGIMTIETGTVTVTFGPERAIADAAGKTLTMDEALAALKINLDA